MTYENFKTKNPTYGEIKVGDVFVNEYCTYTITKIEETKKARLNIYAFSTYHNSEVLFQRAGVPHMPVYRN